MAALRDLVVHFNDEVAQSNALELASRGGRTATP